MPSQEDKREIMVEQLERQFSRLHSAVQSMLHLSHEMAEGVIGDPLSCPKKTDPEQAEAAIGLLPKSICAARDSADTVESINERVQNVLNELGRSVKSGN